MGAMEVGSMVRITSGAHRGSVGRVVNVLGGGAREVRLDGGAQMRVKLQDIVAVRLPGAAAGPPHGGASQSSAAHAAAQKRAAGPGRHPAPCPASRRRGGPAPGGHQRR